MYLLLFLLVGIIPCQASYKQNLYEHRGRNLKIDGPVTEFIQIGNTKNPPGSWPWVVSLGGFGPKYGNWIHECTGVIVKPNQIITTVGCLDSLEDMMGKENIQARAGDDNLKVSLDDNNIQTSKLEDYVIHPYFDSERNLHYHDIAILTMETPFTFNKYVRTIDLPDIDNEEKDANGLLVFSDWGQPNSMSMSARSMLIKPKEDCQKSYPNMVFTKELICGVNSGSLKKMCDVDFGTPIVKHDQEIDRYVLKGLFSTDINEEREKCKENNNPNLVVPISSKCNLQFIYTQLYDENYPDFDKSCTHEIVVKNDNFVYENCGHSSLLDDETKLADSQIKKYPWQVSLGHTNPKNSKEWVHYCGGSIVSPTKIVTAAHCNALLSTMNTANQVRAGDANLQNPNDDEGLQIVDVKYYSTHPEFKNIARYFDVGVITLASPLNMTEYVQPICLLKLEEAKTISKQDETSLPFTTTGWGKDDYNRGGENLKMTVAIVLSEEKCNEKYKDPNVNRNSVPELFTSNVMCATDPTGDSGVCKGDSGGPAAHLDQTKNQYFLRAIVSGSALGICGASFFPNIYVRTADPLILRWILDEVKEAPHAISIERETEIQHNQEVKYKCLVDSYPVYDITWIVRDDSGNEIPKNVNADFVTFNTKNESNSFSITCIAKNRLRIVTTTTVASAGKSSHKSEITSLTVPSIVGIVIGVIVGILLILVMFICFLIKTERYSNIKNKITSCCIRGKKDEEEPKKCGVSYGGDDQVDFEGPSKFTRPKPSAPSEPLLPETRKINLKPEKQRLARISHGQAGTWGVNSEREIFQKTGNGNWKKVDGPKLVDISVGYTEIWGVDENDDVYRFEMINQHAKTPWEKVGGNIVQVSVSPLKLNNTDVWGCDQNNKIFHRQSRGEWKPENTQQLKIKMVTIGEAGVWVINDKNEVYQRNLTYGKIENYTGAITATNPAGWTKVPGVNLKWVSSGNDIVWGINTQDGIVYRDGISESSPTGSDWVLVQGGKLKQIDVWGKSLYGVNDQDRSYYCVYTV